MSLPTASRTCANNSWISLPPKATTLCPRPRLVVKDDPTLLFINSGMAPFKDYFLGNKPAPYKRIADTQKCLRVSGKHNDLEEVGYDTYHHTMFEMLGNWSFGDYFKTEAIAWAWELLTDVYGLEKDRLYVTYFEGDAADGTAPRRRNPEPVAAATRPTTGFCPATRRTTSGKWAIPAPAAPAPKSTSTCALPKLNAPQTPGRELVNADHPQVVEVWNNVFMEFQRLADKSLIKLPEQSVDTGMGFERLMMAVSGVKSNYDTDVFQPLIQFIAQRSRAWNTTAPHRRQLTMNN